MIVCYTLMFISGQSQFEHDFNKNIVFQYFYRGTFNFFFESITLVFCSLVAKSSLQSIFKVSYDEYLRLKRYFKLEPNAS